MRRSGLLFLVVTLLATLISQPASSQNPARIPWRPEWHPPDRGIVPNADTAVRVGTAVLNALEPKARQELEEFKPWHAEVASDGAWEVRGTLPSNMVGGTYVVVIAKQDARIIGIFHEQ